MIERDFDIPFIANLALREKQIQQNYHPVIAVHKSFARRPGTLFRGLILSEFASKPLRESFYIGNEFPGLRVADPFMGGVGSILGAVLGGCLFAFAQNFGVWKISSQWQDAISFLVLLAFLLLRPYGFFGKKIRKAEV